MPEPPSAFAGIEDLVDLGQGSEIDMRPTLLRVLTDLYVQRPAHTPEDERYYTELASRLMDAADPAARRRLAERLASYPSAPRALIARLARDSIEVAAPILRYSSCLNQSDLAAVAAELGGRHAEIIEQRRSALTPAGGGAELARSRSCQRSCRAFRAVLRSGRCRAPFDPASLDYAPVPPIPPSAFVHRSDAWRLEAAALRHNTEVLVRESSNASWAYRERKHVACCGTIPANQCWSLPRRWIYPTDVLQRMLLFMKPRVGQSVDRIYELTELYREVSVAAARRLIAVLREADKDGVFRAHRQPWAGERPRKRAQGAVGALSTAHESAGAGLRGFGEKTVRSLDAGSNLRTT